MVKSSNPWSLASTMTVMASKVLLPYNFQPFTLVSPRPTGTRHWQEQTVATDDNLPGIQPQNPHENDKRLDFFVPP